MTDALDDVVDAALRRALVEEAHARRYFALAGALERASPGTARSASTADPSGSQRPRSDADSTRSGAEPTDVGVGRVGAALATTVALRAIDATRRDGIDAGAWTPGGSDPHGELVVAGARLASRRFDVDAASVADRAGIDPARLTGPESPFRDAR